MQLESHKIFCQMLYHIKMTQISDNLQFSYKPNTFKTTVRQGQINNSVMKSMWPILDCTSTKLLESGELRDDVNKLECILYSNVEILSDLSRERARIIRGILYTENYAILSVGYCAKPCE